MCMSLPKGNGDVHGASLVLLDMSLHNANGNTLCNFGALSARSIPKGNGDVHCAIWVLSLLSLSLNAKEKYTVPCCCSHD